MKFFECDGTRVEVDELRNLFYVAIKEKSEWKRVPSGMSYPADRREFDASVATAGLTGTFGIMSVMKQFRHDCPTSYEQLMKQISR